MRARRPGPSSSISSTWARRCPTCSMRGWCSSPWRLRWRPNESMNPASTGYERCCASRNSGSRDCRAPRDEFHIVLAEQSKNPVLQLFIDVLMRLTTRYALQSQTDSAREAVEALDHLHVDHSEMVAAVTGGDAARAKTLSERHVKAVTAWLQDHHPGGNPRAGAIARRAPHRSASGISRQVGRSTSGRSSATRSSPAAGRSARSSEPRRRCWIATG